MFGAIPAAFALGLILVCAPQHTTATPQVRLSCRRRCAPMPLPHAVPSSLLLDSARQS